MGTGMALLVFYDDLSYDEGLHCCYIFCYISVTPDLWSFSHLVVLPLSLRPQNNIINQPNDPLAPT
jgi:hypothetical protein